MAQHRGALVAACPITARHIVAAWKCPTVRLRAGEYVMHVGFIAAGVDLIASLAQRSFFVEIIVVAVEIVDVFGDDDAFGILPGTFANAITSVDGSLTVGRAGAEIGSPSMVARANRLRERLAVFIGARQAAEVRAFSRSGAGNEESHVVLLFLRAGDPIQGQQNDYHC